MSTRTPLVIRLAYLAVALAWWVGTGLGRLARRRVVVLCYHAVSAAEREAFRRQMRSIAARVVSTAALGELAADGGRGLPWICVTFDDGYVGLREQVFPTTCALRTPITVFAVSENLGRPPAWRLPPGAPEADERLMDAGELREAARTGLVRVGAHTATHPSLPACGPDARLAELAGCRATLEAALGAPVDELALPHGEYDAATLADARRAGYRWIYSLDACAFPATLPPNVVGRYLMSPSAWSIEFFLTCAGAYAWLNAARRVLRRAAGRRAAAPFVPTDCPASQAAITCAAAGREE
jgi:peptidoglycan/xylan/chitin deacetylase (PgdA/CDA1 family)